MKSSRQKTNRKIPRCASERDGETHEQPIPFFFPIPNQRYRIFLFPKIRYFLCIFDENTLLRSETCMFIDEHFSTSFSPNSMCEVFFQINHLVKFVAAYPIC